MATKKVKRTGRFGSRYGVGIRKRLLKIESEQFAVHNCPECGAPKVKRKAPGIFECRKCGYEFAGGAYVPETLAGSIVKKMVSQKSFLPNLKELIEAKELQGAEEKLHEKKHEHVHEKHAEEHAEKKDSEE